MDSGSPFESYHSSPVPSVMSFDTCLLAEDFINFGLYVSVKISKYSDITRFFTHKGRILTSNSGTYPEAFCYWSTGEGSQILTPN